MENSFIDAYICRVDENGKNYRCYMDEIENSLEEFQSIVGGNIEVIRVSDDVLGVVNEDGKFNGLKPSRLWNVDGNMDIVFGNIIFVRSDSDGNFTSVEPEDIDIILEQFTAIKCIRDCNGISGIVTIPDKFLEEWEEYER